MVSPTLGPWTSKVLSGPDGDLGTHLFRSSKGPTHGEKEREGELQMVQVKPDGLLIISNRKAIKVITRQLKDKSNVGYREFCSDAFRH